jgi:hypothetical protein
MKKVEILVLYIGVTALVTGIALLGFKSEAEAILDQKSDSVLNVVDHFWWYASEARPQLEERVRAFGLMGPASIAVGLIFISVALVSAAEGDDPKPRKKVKAPPPEEPPGEPEVDFPIEEVRESFKIEEEETSSAEDLASDLESAMGDPAFEDEDEDDDKE